MNLVSLTYSGFLYAIFGNEHAKEVYFVLENSHTFEDANNGFSGSLDSNICKYR